MTDSGGSKTFLRDGVSVTSPVLSDGNADYTPAISERRSSTTTFYHAGIKNGDSQSSTSESVTGSIQYDAFGNVTSSSGTWQGPFAYGGPYGYQSDPDSGLKLLGHRYYDPSTGRFLTRDPVKDGRNWYGYCGNAPISLADPTGTIAWVPIIIAIIVIIDI
ncbi:MAG: RHS repeat-associated core domain-containing protein, partial [Fimbriimonadaceae bacterium]|nr:RHS repeat-associated core domain-containing protein [Fimbriimonadaceae bacterium]